MIRIPKASGIPDPKLDVRDLRAILAIAGAGSTAAAATTLHLTQSAVSRALAVVEDKLGVKLFERRPRGLVVTAAGQRLVDGAGALLTQLGELERTVADGTPPPTELRVVCECYTAYRWLPSAIVQLRQNVPNVHVVVAVEHTARPAEALADGDIDIALLTTSALPASSELEERALFSDEVVFVMAASHPLAKKRALSPRDLEATTLVTGNAPPGEGRWFVNAVFGKRKPKLELVRFPLTEAIVDAVRAGMGVAVLSEWIASGYLGAGDLVVRRLASGPLRRPWRIAYRKSAAVTAQRIVATLGIAAPKLPHFVAKPPAQAVYPAV